MGALTGQSIASSYEQLLHVDTDGGGNTTTLVPVKDGDNGTTFALQLSTTTAVIDNPTADSSSQGGILRLQSDDGALMQSGSRLGVIEFAGAEDSSSTITVGGRIESVTDAAWSASENGADMVFYTTDGNASQSEVLRLTADNMVGIGTSSPTSELNLRSANPILIWEDSSGSALHGQINVNGNYLNIRSMPNDKSSATERLSVDLSTGNVGIGTASPDANTKLDVNGVIRAQSGIQPNGNAYSASEVLDDYEEGTWTGTLTDGSNAMSMDNSTCSYTKVGKIVYVGGYINASSIGSASGDCKISGLPFTPGPAAAPGNSSLTVGRATNLNITAGHAVQINVLHSNTVLQLTVFDATGGTTNLTTAEASGDALLVFAGTYQSVT